jgi:phosphoribosyl 1,2-cyclic phosphate phosphodiesterase
MARLRFTILGCGSSGGVPRLGLTGAQWGDCQQLMAAGAGRLDAVVYSHSHADHVHGIDDLRAVVLNMRARLPVWADAPTQSALLTRFDYAFTQAEGSPYPSILDLRDISGPFRVDGPGGAIPFTPFTVDHGSMDALGFRIGDLAYLPDVVRIPAVALPHLEGLQVWILDALRRTPHPTHIHLALSLEWIEKLAPRAAVLTNMHIDMDYDTLCAELPAHIRPAFDGMILEMDLAE